jgi:hypothetical protein
VTALTGQGAGWPHDRLVTAPVERRVDVQANEGLLPSRRRVVVCTDARLMSGNSRTWRSSVVA